MLNAQQDSVDLLDMSLEELMNMEVYVTSRTESQSANDAAATVILINEQQIKSRGYNSLLDIFYDLPDFKVDYGVDPRWMNDVTIRGIRYMNKFVIMLNGVRISSPTNDMIAIMENYPLVYAKQVEIVFGPASALYGADAFSGVINIITKDSNKKTTFETNQGGGMYQTVTSNLFLQHNFSKKASLMIGGQYFYDRQPDLSKYYPEEYEGMEEELQTGTFNTIFGPITPTAEVAPEKSTPLNSYGTFAMLKLGDIKFSYFGNHSQNPSTQANSPHNAVYNKSSKFGHFINMGNISYEKEIKKLISISHLTYSRYDLDNKSNFRNIWTNMEPAYLFAYGWMAKAEQIFDFSVNKRMNITFGGSYSYYESMPRSNNLQFPVSGVEPEGIIVNSIAPNNPDGIVADLIKTEYSTVGGLAQILYKLDKLSITVGTRIDNDQRFGLAINPRAGLVFRPNSRVTLKALFGKAYIAPSPQYMYDRYGTFATFDDGQSYMSFFFQLPNPNLQPEIVKTGELSSQVLLSKNLNFSVTTYISLVEGSINPSSDSTKISELYPESTYLGYPVLSIQINDNLGTSTIYGGSATINYILNFQKNKVNAYASYSYVDGFQDIDEDGEMPARNLPGVSPHSFRVGLNYSYNQKLNFSPRIIVLGKQRTFNRASYMLTDNTKYQEIDGYFLLNANLRYDFGKFGLFVSGFNLLNQRYRNVNIGCRPDGTPENEETGSAAVEFYKGTPQNPIRITGGVFLNL